MFVTYIANEAMQNDRSQKKRMRMNSDAMRYCGSGDARMSLFKEELMMTYELSRCG